MGRIKMRKGIIVLVIISFTALFLSGCASKKSGENEEQAGKQSKTVKIQTGDHHEFCDMWEPGDIVRFSFTSTKPVIFNVHYHTAYAKHYPIKDTLVDEFSGDFTVETKDVHCGMWQNKNDNFVKVTYEMEVTK